MVLNIKYQAIPGYNLPHELRYIVYFSSTLDCCVICRLNDELRGWRRFLAGLGLRVPQSKRKDMECTTAKNTQREDAYEGYPEQFTHIRLSAVLPDAKLVVTDHYSD